MILHTIVPMERILENRDVKRNCKEISVSGVSCEVEIIDETRARIVRLFTTDPSLYLDPRWQPGMIVEFSANFSSRKV